MENKSERIKRAIDIVAEFPRTSKKQLGVVLYERNPLLYKSAEDARTCVRQATGNCGKDFLKNKDKTPYIGFQGVSVHDGEVDPFIPYVIEQNIIGILSDIHLPYQDNKALNIALEKCLDEKVDMILLNGDILDCYQVSYFDKNPTKSSFIKEVEMMCIFLKDLRRIFGDIKILFKLGNHEERLERYLMSKAPAIFNIECFNIEKLIEIEYQRLFDEKLIWDVVKNKRVMQFASLSIVHGHEFGNSFFSPVNPARGYFMRAKTSILGGHNHQTSEHIESDLNGKIIGAFSTGCLCKLNPDYHPINKWNHGFAIAKRANNNYNVRNFKIIDGQLV